MRSGPVYPRGPGAASSAQRGTLRSDTIGATYTQDPRHLATRRLPSMRGAIAPIKTLPRSESAQLDHAGHRFGERAIERKSVVEGKSGAESVALGGGRDSKKQRANEKKKTKK